MALSLLYSFICTNTVDYSSGTKLYNAQMECTDRPCVINISLQTLCIVATQFTVNSNMY